jgi:ABC-2 type transport system ATP-binding protein
MDAPALEILDVRTTFSERESPPPAAARGAARLRLRLPRRRVLHAVDGVSLRIGRGEIFGILGPNGSGKSTLVRLVCTLLLPDGGSVRVFGHDVTREPMAVRRLINRVSVEAAFFKKLSSWENLAYAARLYGLAPSAARAEVEAIATRLGLPPHKLHTAMEHLSRGQQQKVAIARALLTSPVLLLLDEPTTGLDPRSKREVQAFVRELRDEHDATVLLTSHDMEEVDRLCDRVAVMNAGRIADLDTPAGLKARHAGAGGSLEDVFLRLTGRDWEDVLSEQWDGPDGN